VRAERRQCVRDTKTIRHCVRDNDKTAVRQYETVRAGRRQCVRDTKTLRHCVRDNDKIAVRQYDSVCMIMSYCLTAVLSLA